MIEIKHHSFECPTNLKSWKCHFFLSFRLNHYSSSNLNYFCPKVRLYKSATENILWAKKCVNSQTIRNSHLLIDS